MAATPASTPTSAAQDATGGGFGDLITGSLQQAADLQSQSDGLMRQAATGELRDVSQLMSAMTEAQLATQLTVALRNRAVESFNEIMRLQL